MKLPKLNLETLVWGALALASLWALYKAFFAEEKAAFVPRLEAARAADSSAIA
jgi:hypothetical protein